MLRTTASVLKQFKLQFSSALYITGDKAQTHFAALTPVVDFDNELQHKETLIENIKARKLAVNLVVVEENWNLFKEIESRKNILEQTKSEIGQVISKLMKVNNPSSEVSQELEKLKTHLKLIKDELKTVKTMGYSVEENAMLQVLNLPNILHPKTPEHEELEVYRYLERNEQQTDSHMNIGIKNGCLKYTDHSSCYLKSEAALFELAVQKYFNSELVNLKFSQFSNSDFVKSVIVEGCGTEPFIGDKVLILEDIHCTNNDGFNKLHLVGAASLYSFMAYFTRLLVLPNQFPINAFCIGRSYQSVKNTSPKDLFHLNQSTEIGVFMANLDEADILENVINQVSELYKQLGYHFKLVILPASKIEKSECLRLSIQMFSNSLLKYIEVGYVSFYGNYLSKRLLFSCSDKTERRYPFVVSGSLMNIQKVIGCILENNEIRGNPLLNQFLSKYVF